MLGRNAAPDVFKLAVRDAVLCTHVHPEGVEGALAQAAAVAALSLSTPTSERRCCVYMIVLQALLLLLCEVCASQSHLHSCVRCI
jgi:ADP-ribosylglycohydrolase